MKKIVRQFRLLIFILILRLAMWILPNDAIDTLNWFLKIPHEK